MSKVDPTQLKKLDRRSTMLLQASKTFVDGDGEKSLSGAEDPGMDALRGSFGAFGSIVRAKSVKHLSRTMSTANQGGPQRRHGLHPLRETETPGKVQRHQLYDAPVASDLDGLPKGDGVSISSMSVALSSPPPRSSAIKFDDEDVEHYYPSSRKDGDRLAPRHQSRAESSTGSILVRHDRTPSPLRKTTEEDLSRSDDETPHPERGTFKMTFTDPFNVSTEQPSTPRKQQLSYDEGTPPPAGTLKGHFRTSSKGNSKVSSPRTPRQYPTGIKQDDREQSISLVNDNSENEGEADLDDDAAESVDDDMLRTGGIRLLSTTTRI